MADPAIPHPVTAARALLTRTIEMLPDASPGEMAVVLADYRRALHDVTELFPAPACGRG